MIHIYFLWSVLLQVIHFSNFQFDYEFSMDFNCFEIPRENRMYRRLNLSEKMIYSNTSSKYMMKIQYNVISLYCVTW